MEAGMNKPLIPRDAASVLIVCPSWVGDTVMATPVLRAIRHAMPRSRLIGLMRPGLDELLAGTPWLDETIAATIKGFTGPWRAAARIKSAKPQAALLLPNSFRSALTLRLSGAPVRVGYARDGRSWLLTGAVEVAKSKQPTPTLEYYTHLAERALSASSIDRRMELTTTPAQRDAAGELLSGVGEQFIVLNPGGNKPAKRWPAERFAAAADSLADSHGLAAVVTGSPGEMDVLESVVSAAKKPIINLARRGLSLGSLKAVLARASLLITNDTGPRHIAAALGTPVVTLFGPTDHRWTTIDCPHERIIVADPFLPEELIADRNARRCAIERIPVVDVVAAARQLLARRESNAMRRSGTRT